MVRATWFLNFLSAVRFPARSASSCSSFWRGIASVSASRTTPSPPGRFVPSPLSFICPSSLRRVTRRCSAPRPRAMAPCNFQCRASASLFPAVEVCLRWTRADLSSPARRMHSSFAFPISPLLLSATGLVRSTADSELKGVSCSGLDSPIRSVANHRMSYRRACGRTRSTVISDVPALANLSSSSPWTVMILFSSASTVTRVQ
mmetsp:Transcript_52128/g.156468  ORF Transcript_52128/g.156468 Transcript_52128/m.156468 type:complete len:203 (+) Transcript_52128:2764-3372(+)